jgi:hypothetical protein
MKHTLRYNDHDMDLPEGEFVIGRAANCQLSLDDPLVSRNHATLSVTTDNVVVADLGSRNGVRVNGDRIDGKRTLIHGDQISIGSQDMTLMSRREFGADTLILRSVPPLSGCSASWRTRHSPWARAKRPRSYCSNSSISCSSTRSVGSA